MRNKTAIDIRIESCDLLRLFEVKDYIKNTKREIDLAFGDLIEILGIGIILVLVALNIHQDACLIHCLCCVRVKTNPNEDLYY